MLDEMMSDGEFGAGCIYLNVYQQRKIQRIYS